MFYTEGIGKLFYVIHPYFSLLIKLTSAQLFQHQNVQFSHVFFGSSSPTAFLYPLCVFTQRCAQKTTQGFLFCFNCLHRGTRLICHIYYNKWDQFHSLTNRRRKQYYVFRNTTYHRKSLANAPDSLDESRAFIT